jgi:hypothetical protein
MNELRKYLLIAAAFLIVGCRTSDNSRQSSANVETPKGVPSPALAKAENSDSSPPVRVETLDDFERSGFFRDYKLRKRDGWELNTGAYNNSYETPSLSDISIEVQTVENKKLKRTAG